MKTPISGVFVGLAFLLLASPCCLWAQTRDCEPRDVSAMLRAESRVYSDAKSLEQFLNQHGIKVNCVLESKMQSFFQGQEGAAFYRTSLGDFDVLFLPTPQSFARLRIIERRVGEHYVYTLQGIPRPRSSNRIEGRRVFFLKHASELFLLSDEDAHAEIAAALNSGTG